MDNKYYNLDKKTTKNSFLIKELKYVWEAVEKVRNAWETERNISKFSFWEEMSYGSFYKENFYREYYSDKDLLQNMPSTKLENELFEEYFAIKFENNRFNHLTQQDLLEKISNIETQLQKILDCYSDEDIRLINSRALEKIKQFEYCT